MMKTICKRLRGGDDLLGEIQRLAAYIPISAGVVLSAVGNLRHLRLGDGKNVTELDGHVEIVSITGTVSARRSHLHLCCARDDLSTLGGHLAEGCIVDTTCELVIGILDDWRFGVERDPVTGNDELQFAR